MLTEKEFIRDESAIDDSHAFADQVGARTLELGLGRMAVRNAEEFVAEALAWRMTPRYGSSVETPRMPRFLEDWLHECFPFLLDGAAPRSCFVFDAAGYNVDNRESGRPRFAPGVSSALRASAGPGSSETAATSVVRTGTVRRIDMEAADLACVD